MIRLLIADSHPVVREGIRSVVTAAPDIQLVAEAEDGTEAVDRTLEYDPDVVIMELKLPKMDGLSVLRALQTRAPRSRVILFTATESKDDFIEAMKLGCSGILMKNASPGLILKSIQKVNAGEIWLDSNTTAAVIRQFASPSDFPAAQHSRRKDAGACTAKPARTRTSC